jgi:hypothetical protein
MAEPFAEQPRLTTLDRENVAASMAQCVRMNVRHPDPIGGNRQLTGKAIRRHPRTALRGEDPFVGFAIAVAVRQSVPLRAGRAVASTREPSHPSAAIEQQAINYCNVIPERGRYIDC